MDKDAFFALLRAGLWEQGVKLRDYEPLDFVGIYNWADEQAVIGLVAAGLEHVEDRKVTKPEAVQFLKKVFSLEGTKFPKRKTADPLNASDQDNRARRK